MQKQNIGQLTLSETTDDYQMLFNKPIQSSKHAETHSNSGHHYFWA